MTMFMLPEEQLLCKKLDDAYKDFIMLDKLHPSHQTEFLSHIHHLQNIIMTRAGIRAFPDCYSGPKEKK